jgi:hypothetical protein
VCIHHQVHSRVYSTQKQAEDGDSAMNEEHEKNLHTQQRERNGGDAARAWGDCAMTGTQLWNASSHGDKATVKNLLSQPTAHYVINYQVEDGRTPLHMTAQAGHEVVVKQLIAVRCNVDLQMKDGSTPLLLAAKNGHATVTEQLIAVRGKLQQDVTSICSRKMGPHHFTRRPFKDKRPS